MEARIISKDDVSLTYNDPIVHDIVLSSIVVATPENLVQLSTFLVIDMSTPESLIRFWPIDQTSIVVLFTAAGANNTCFYDHSECTSGNQVQFVPVSEFSLPLKLLPET